MISKNGFFSGDENWLVFGVGGRKFAKRYWL
jgi:hypothetical protein